MRETQQTVFFEAWIRRAGLPGKERTFHDYAS